MSSRELWLVLRGNAVQAHTTSEAAARDKITELEQLGHTDLCAERYIPKVVRITCSACGGVDEHYPGCDAHGQNLDEAARESAEECRRESTALPSWDTHGPNDPSDRRYW